MKTRILVIVMLLISFSVSSGEWSRSIEEAEGQDPKWVLSQIEKFYSTQPFIYHDLQYRLYPNHTTTIPHSSESGVFIKDGNRQYARLGIIESLVTKDYMLSIDSEEKIMMISNRVHIAPTNPVTQFDRIMLEGSDLKVNKLSDTHAELVIISELGEVKESKMVYNIASFEPIKLILMYRRFIQLSEDSDTDPVAPRLEINYLQTNLTGKESDKLNLNTYVTQINGRWKVTPAFNAYELINNIQSINIQN